MNFLNSFPFFLFFRMGHVQVSSAQIISIGRPLPRYSAPPLMTQTSSATSEVLYLLTYLFAYLLARVSIEGLSSVKAPP